MKHVGSLFERWLSRHFPRTYYQLVQRPRFKFRFRAEKRLADGVQLSSSSHPSIIFFTTQKCASRYVSSVISALAETAGMVHADYDAYVSMIKVPKLKNPFSPEGTLSSAFNSHGYYYGPIGTYRGIPNLENYKIVLQLRDPRDVLTSLFFPPPTATLSSTPNFCGGASRL